MKIVVADGISALTITRLAQEADAAVGAVYRYFPSKDALLAALQERAVTRFGAFLDASLDRASDAPLARVWAAAVAWPAFADAEPDAYALADASLSNPAAVLSDESAAAVDRALAPILSKCAALIEAAAAEGALAPGPPLLRAHALWAAMHGVAHFKKRDRLGVAARSSAIRDELVAALLIGWGADPRRVRG